MMRYKGLDLNLLVAFDALMRTRSVTAAGARLNLSQSAMSAALSRMRAFFNDDLFVANGKRMHPTAFAESLLPFVNEGLRSFEALLATPTAFDPATSVRQFRIVASDYVIAAILKPVVTKIAEAAPNIRLEIGLPGEDAVVMLDEGKIDLIITPDYVISSDHPAEPLYEERFVLAGWSGNPLFAGRITEEDFFSAGHVAVAIGSTGASSYADRQLEVIGRNRRVEMIAPFFSAVPWLIEGTMRLAILHERMARALSGRFEIAVADLPFAMPPLKQCMFFHQARTNDLGLEWLRNQIRTWMVL